MTKVTYCLDYDHPTIQKLIKEKEWLKLGDNERINAIYDFVQNDILFGYNGDDYRASHLILEDGYGQCNTKAILLMSLLNACDIECRIHGAIVDKSLQKGILSGLVYRLAPHKIIHSWVEVHVQENWYALEGVILDEQYLDSIKKMNPHQQSYCGYGVAVKDLSNVDVSWSNHHTYIQKETVVKDLGLFDTPDVFLKSYHQNMNLFKKWIYQYIIRHQMNHKVKQIRSRT